MIRTRFAPSPTGYLHLGSARTALFCWAFARRHQGQFILRVEDTDRERSTQEAIDVIVAGMAWLNLDYDEGPIFQTKRMARYQEVIQQLLANGSAYRCTCSKARLTTVREQQIANKQKPRYDGHCREAGYGDIQESHVIRFKNPVTGSVQFQDGVHGFIEVANSELDDLVILRSDGMPTYNFCVVVDDWDMQISHVIRGTDHINNTPRQINIFKALSAPIPQYVHIPMILGPDGKKLSKRHGAVSILEFRDQGYLPEAMLNVLVRLGWSHGDQEIFSVDEIKTFFDVEHINKAGACFDPQKLDWLNQHYLKNYSSAALIEKVTWHFQQLGITPTASPVLGDVIALQCERVKTLRELAAVSRYFYQEVTEYAVPAREKFLTQATKPILECCLQELSALTTWDKAACHDAINRVADIFSVKLGKIAQPIRVALTGDTISPSIDATMVVLGQKLTLERLQRAIDFIEIAP